MEFFIAVLPAFLASTVEFVEAYTVVLAVGLTRGWRSSLWGAAAAITLLAVAIGIFGTALVHVVNRHLLQVIVGSLLLLFGTRWLRKAMLRYAGYVAIHDEEKIFNREMRELEGGGQRRGMDWAAFAISFKTTALEGLEVAFIVIGLGAKSHTALVASSIGAVVALVVVVIAGSMVRAPLSRVPENTLKYFVGVLLCTFGVFWTSEGFGVVWPGDAVWIPVLAVCTLALSWVSVLWLRGGRKAVVEVGHA